MAKNIPGITILQRQKYNLFNSISKHYAENSISFKLLIALHKDFLILILKCIFYLLHFGIVFSATYAVALATKSSREFLNKSFAQRDKMKKRHIMST